MIGSLSRNTGTVPEYVRERYNSMPTPVNNNPHWAVFERNFSSPRMNPYLKRADFDENKAVELFEWNLEASLKFWPLIAHTEVALRNALAVQMNKLAIKNSYSKHWTEDEKGLLGSFKQNPRQTTYGEIIKAKGRISKKKIQLSPDQIIAELSLGFWSNLVSSTFTNIWPDLLNAFPNIPQRSQINVTEPLLDLKFLRNRIAHHEKIWNLDLNYYLASIQNLNYYLDQDLIDYTDFMVINARNYSIPPY